MGLTFLEIEVGNPANPAVTEKLDFVVDSGAIYSVVPISVLERLGIRPLAEQEFRLPTGQRYDARKAVPSSSMESGWAWPTSFSEEKGTACCWGPSPWKPLGWP